jgi:hypothetical protein
LLDGTSSGQPGSSYRSALTWRNLVLDPPAHHAKRHKQAAQSAQRAIKATPEKAVDRSLRKDRDQE